MAQDVFVSYRSDDREWVETCLEPLLTSSGISYFVYHSDDNAELPTSIRLREAQAASQWTIAVISNAYGTSPFTDWEFRAALHAGCLVPIRAEDCDTPEGILQSEILDFVSSDDQARNGATLIRKIKEQPGGSVRSSSSHQVHSDFLRDYRLARSAYEFSLAGADMHGAFLILRDSLFEPLHYTFASFMDNADLLWTARSVFSAKKDWVIELLAQRPLTGSMVPCTGHGERECPYAWILAALGVTYRALWQRGKAEELFAEALERYEHARIDSGIVTLRINLGDVAWERGDIGRSLAHLDVALAVASRAGATDLQAIVHQDFGHRLAFSGDWVASEKHLGEAEALAEGDSHRLGIICAHRARQALLHYRSLRPDAGDDERERCIRTLRINADRAHNFHRSKGFERHNVRAAWFRAVATILEGAEREGLTALETALEHCQYLGLAELEADIQLDIVRCELALSRPDAAADHLREAGSMASRCGRVIQQIDAKIVFACLQFVEGNAMSARATIAQVIDRIERRTDDRGVHLGASMAEARARLAKFERDTANE